MMDEEFLARIEKFWPVTITRRIHFPEPQNSSLDIALTKAYYDRVWAQDQDIANLNNKMDTMDKRINKLRHKIFMPEVDSLSRRIHFLEGHLETDRILISKADKLFNGIKKDLDKLRDRVEVIESTAKSNGDNINDLEDRVATNESDISEIRNQVDNIECVDY